MSCSGIEKRKNLSFEYLVFLTFFVFESTFIIKEIKNAPECIVELYKHAGIFKNTREVHREARGLAECFSHFSSVLKNSRVLI